MFEIDAIDLWQERARNIEEGFVRQTGDRRKRNFVNLRDVSARKQ
jgi:hypothetical protein